MFFLILLASAVSSLHYDNLLPSSPPCFTEGTTWGFSEKVDIFPEVPSVYPCQDLCLLTPTCEKFTWYTELAPESFTCLLYGETTIKYNCTNCVSGPKVCPTTTTTTPITSTTTTTTTQTTATTTTSTTPTPITTSVTTPPTTNTTSTTITSTMTITTTTTSTTTTTTTTATTTTITTTTTTKTTTTTTTTTITTTTTTTTTTPTPANDWYYVETQLEGGRVLTVAPDGFGVIMWEKSLSLWNKQKWRIEESGCLRSKSSQKNCLTVLGDQERALLGMMQESGDKAQRWSLKSSYLESAITPSLFKHLFLDIICPDVPLNHNGVGVNVAYKDYSKSQKWRMRKF